MVGQVGFGGTGGMCRTRVAQARRVLRAEARGPLVQLSRPSRPDRSRTACHNADAAGARRAPHHGPGSLKSRAACGPSSVPFGTFLSTCAAPFPRHGRVWTPPLMQAFLWASRACGQVLPCVRPLDAARHWPRACMEIRGSGPNRTSVLERTAAMAGFPDPVSSTVCPYPSSDLLTSPRASRASPPAQAAAGAR